jgi:hypothetical protein
LAETRLENFAHGCILNCTLRQLIIQRIFIFLPVGENSPREFRAWMHSELHSLAVNHPGAQRAVLPRKKNAELSSHRQTDKPINIVRLNINIISNIYFRFSLMNIICSKFQVFTVDSLSDCFH